MIGQTVYKQTEKKRLLFYISRYIIYYRVSLKHFSFFVYLKGYINIINIIKSLLCSNCVKKRNLLRIETTVF